LYFRILYKRNPRESEKKYCYLFHIDANYNHKNILLRSFKSFSIYLKFIKLKTLNPRTISFVPKASCFLSSLKNRKDIGAGTIKNDTVIIQLDITFFIKI